MTATTTGAGRTANGPDSTPTRAGRRVSEGGRAERAHSATGQTDDAEPVPRRTRHANLVPAPTDDTDSAREQTDRRVAGACAFCRQPLAHPARGRRRRYCSRSCQARAYRARRDALTPTHRTAPARRPTGGQLTAVGIARTAVDLADRLGIDGLSTRRLAGELGVATAALYRHYPDREALLAAMAELALAEVPPPPPELTGWRERVAYEARQEWQLYQRHPWVLPVLARTRPPIGPALFDILERIFSALDQPGMTARDILSTYLAVSGLVQGMGLLWSAEHVERALDPDTHTGEQVHAELAELLDPTSRPVMDKLFGASGPPDIDFDGVLDAGVELLLDGVAARFARLS
ncbi:TetR/AcrR family transcriptional regulator C-terminal domain-containing protein [Nocardia cyriacigeorgica]|uniref:TetR/AcrR family transcriptional regulator C-terminal domain-containing protein n=1 Tax=Nocardia cyriacigeorgica TaxID=135487 RepID=UPI0021142262|nr:TetR/AcrR family transcriptional regulator C-terminal domain-containing protein [Nocardia cyriacigeorgica]